MRRCLGPTILATALVLWACHSDDSHPDAAVPTDAGYKTEPCPTNANCNADFPPVCSVRCASPGELCAPSDGCCVCYKIRGNCGSLWQCAYPSKNPSDCPSTMPTEGSKCSSSSQFGGPTCYYCEVGAPITFFCSISTSTWQVDSSESVACVGQ